MFRKPTSCSIKPKTLRIQPRPPYSVRSNQSGQEVKSLVIDIPLELVHQHNAQNPKVNIEVNTDLSFDPVLHARMLRHEAEERDTRKKQANLMFLKKTMERSSMNNVQSPEEIERLKQKFRVRSLILPIEYYRISFLPSSHIRRRSYDLTLRLRPTRLLTDTTMGHYLIKLMLMVVGVLIRLSFQP